jgi:hypothetical protein
VRTGEGVVPNGCTKEFKVAAHPGGTGGSVPKESIRKMAVPGASVNPANGNQLAFGEVKLEAHGRCFGLNQMQGRYNPSKNPLAKYTNLGMIPLILTHIIPVTSRH